MANTKVTGALIADATITATNIADGAVTAAKLTGITTTSIDEGDKLFYTDARVGTYLTANGYDTAANIIATITDSAPVTLDTLNELAAALGDDPNYATTTANLIGTKLPLAGGTLTGNLGIGVSPSVKLDVNGSVYVRTGGTLFVDTIAAYTSGSVSLNSSTDFIIPSGELNIGVTSALLPSAGRGNFSVNGNSDSVVTLGVGGSWSSYYYTNGSATFLASKSETPIHLEAGGSTKLTVASGGNVGIGIGTATPTKTLDVNGVIRSRNSFNISDGTTQIGGLFPYKVITGAGTDNSLALFTETGLDLHFMTNGSVSSKMIIDSSGFVGINETSPTSQLHLSRQTVWGTSENRVININNTGTGGNINVAHNMGAITWYSGNSTPTAGIQAWRNTPASGNNIELRFDTAAGGIPYERMRIDSLGRIGIGSPSVGSLLHIQKNVEDGLGPDLALYNGAYNAGSFSRIRMGRQPNRNASIKAIARTAGGRNNDIVFETKLGDGGDDSTYTEIARILYAGGITFNGDTAAANALDDYEEGTWTATYTDGADNTYTGNYSSRDGRYTKIGNMVYATFQLIATSDIEANGLTGTSSLQISGLPYASNSQHFSGGHITNFQSNGRNMNSIRLMIARGSTKIFFRDYNNTTEVSLNVNEVNGSSTLFYGYVIYRV